uniref:Uncharacterized protein n=1 Tax=Oryza meridionalis TaxID=40149 RepID=A0A0E0CU61_9ORYZ
MVWMMLIHGPKSKLVLTENGWPSPTATRCQNPNIGTGIRGTCRGRVQTREAAGSQHCSRSCASWPSPLWRGGRRAEEAGVISTGTSR